MEFKLNVQAELYCNKDGYAVVYVSQLVNEEYVNSDKIMEVVSKMRQKFKAVSIC